MAATRQQIIDAIQTRMKQIAPGFVFTLPSAAYTCGSTIKDVYQWRKVPFSLAQVPAIEFRDTDDKVHPGPSTQHEHRLHIGLDVYFTGSAAVAAGRAAMQDIIAAIGSDPRWGGLARWTDIDDSNLDMEQSGDIIAGVQVNFTVTYRTPLWRI